MAPEWSRRKRCAAAEASELPASWAFGLRLTPWDALHARIIKRQAQKRKASSQAENSKLRLRWRRFRNACIGRAWTTRGLPLLHIKILHPRRRKRSSHARQAGHHGEARSDGRHRGKVVSGTAAPAHTNIKTGLHSPGGTQLGPVPKSAGLPDATHGGLLTRRRQVQKAAG
jgi:hypothetical protein